jgi:hypothetical protein
LLIHKLMYRSKVLGSPRTIGSRLK